MTDTHTADALRYSSDRLPHASREYTDADRVYREALGAKQRLFAEMLVLNEAVEALQNK